MKRVYFSLVLILFLLGSLIILTPKKVFQTPTSTILEDTQGRLLGAKIAEDGQWRFPPMENVPYKMEKAIITFEDKNFFYHPGIDLLAIGKACWDNIKSGRVVRGGSTLTMQVIRLSRKNRKRTFVEKFIEAFLAFGLEVKFSKKEILNLYFSEAPFGGNVVGLETASWRYFGQPSNNLSWAESALLAVLPNSPSLLFPGKNHDRLKWKRDNLLKKLRNKGLIDSLSYELAILEPIPGKPISLPTFAPHLLVKAEKDGLKGKRVIASLDFNLQKRASDILRRHYYRLAANGVHNSAAIVLEVETGRVMAYCGNIVGVEDKRREHGFDVDLIQSKRSTGSILKPFLFGLLLNKGKYLSRSLVADIPTLIGGYAPKNYFLTYDGAVTFTNVVSRSLNVPSVRLLHEYGVERFHAYLKKMGMSTLNRPASHYGLSIILGGAEGSLWNLAGIYRRMAYSLNQYNNFRPYTFSGWPYYSSLLKDSTNQSKLSLDPASIWLTFEAMNLVARPEEDASWRDYASSYKIAWKTGTSFGNRDGWAIGVTPKYVVAVWAGNADGEGRPDLTGIGSAAPIMFDIFKRLQSPKWFKQPKGDMKKIAICKKSGFKATEVCEKIEEQWVQKAGVNSPLCPYHKIVYLDKKGAMRVNSECESVSQMQKFSWFVLPPSMEHYYKNRSSDYKVAPAFRKDCALSSASIKTFDIIYPQRGSKIVIPKELDETKGKTVFEVACSNNNSTLYWYLDEYYIGSTKEFHELAITPEKGNHTLTVTNEKGESRRVLFQVINEK